MAQVACILGNDCLKKVPGTGKKQGINFVNRVVDCDGNFVEDEQVYEHIREQIVSNSTHLAGEENKQKWKDTSKNIQIDLLYISTIFSFLAMFDCIDSHISHIRSN